MLNIYQRINAVMKEVTYLQKDKKKLVNGQYSFISHDQVAAALHEPMTRHGIVMLPTVVEMTQDSNRTTAKICVSFVNMDKPDDRFDVIYYGYGIDSQDKGPGKAISYAVKYALLKTFCLETGDDVEKDLIEYEPQKAKAPSQKVQPIEIDQDTLKSHKKALIAAIGADKGELMASYLTKSSKALNKTIDQIVMDYTPDAFKRDFLSWTNRQSIAKQA